MVSDGAMAHFFSTALCALLLIFCALLLPVGALSNDGETLLAIKGQYMGAEGTRKGFWESWKQTDEDPCNWVGVRCTSTNHTVEALELSDWGLAGALPDLIKLFGSLPDLKELLLQSNDLGSIIPQDVDKHLGALTRLDLTQNQIWGSIPTTINEMRSLRYLFLGSNHLSGEIPSLDHLADLQALTLADNELSGSVPQLQNLTSLLFLDMSNNSLNGSIPAVQGLTNLVTVNLKSNSLIGGIPLLDHLPNLRTLLLAQNQLTGFTSGSVNLPSLIALNLTSNLLLGEIPLGIRSDRTLTVDLSRNRLTGGIPADLLRPASIGLNGYVNLAHNSLVGTIPDPRLGQGINVSELGFDVLDLSDNQLSGPIPPIFVNLTINHLRLQDNHLSGNIQALLTEGVESFVELRLEGNSLTGDLTETLDGYESRNWSRLNVLDLSHNGLILQSTWKYADPLQTILDSSAYLGELRLAGVNSIGVNLLSERWLNRTEFKPQASKQLKYLEILDLSNCNLEGEISGDVFNPTYLPNLRILNLSNNLLRGPVPASITQIPFLTCLDVSNNFLSGPLPASLPASLWNTSSFSNNPELCGGPLTPCSDSNDQTRMLLSIVVASVLVSLCSCSLLVWRWLVYSKRHQQDADLIAILLERDTATLMPLRELRKATNNFSKSSEIGVGGFGTVYKGKLSDGSIVAIKQSKPQGKRILEDKQQFLNEVRILSQVNHRHLVKLLGCCMENKISLLVFEYIANGTLEEHLHGRRGGMRLNWRQRLNIAVQTADALAYLHSAANPPIYHRDVKPANILLDADLNVKVADFGISKLAPLEGTHVSTAANHFTFGYVDPEYFISSHLSSKSDVYSFGVVLLELISAQSAIRRGCEIASLVGFATPLIKKGEIEELVDPVLLGILGSVDVKESILNVGRLAVNCLALSSKNRPSMKEVGQQLHTLWLQSNASFHPLCISPFGTSSQSNLSRGSPHSSSCLLSNSSRSSTGSAVQLATLPLSSTPSSYELGSSHCTCRSCSRVHQTA